MQEEQKPRGLNILLGKEGTKKRARASEDPFRALSRPAPREPWEGRAGAGGKAAPRSQAAASARPPEPLEPFFTQ